MPFIGLDDEAGLIQNLVSTGKCAVDVIGHSVEGNPIRMLRIGNPPPAPTARPSVMYVGMQHGLEPAGREALLSYAQRLVGPHLAVQNVAGSYASTPNSSTLNITSDLDIRADIDRDALNSLAYKVAKYTTTGNQRSYGLRINTSGAINLIWSTDGSGFMDRSSTETVHDRLPIDSNRIAIRAALNVNNSAGSWELRFYTAPALDGPWTQLGETVIESGSTSIFNGTANLTINGHTNGSSGRFAGRVYGVEVRNGINGPVIAGPRFQQHEPGATSIIDSSGNTWTVNGSATITTPVTSDQRDFLSDHGVHMIPSVNPDGFEATTRRNANDIDLNRDWVALSQPESRAVSKTVGQLNPRILIDHHEYVGTVNRNDIEANRPGGPQCHSAIIARGTELRDAVLNRAGADGWSNDHWGPSNRGDLVVLDINSSLRHIVSLIIETNRTGNPTEEDRVSMHFGSIDEIFDFARINLETVEESIDLARLEKAQEGADGDVPFNIRGGNILDPPPLGYQVVGLIPNFHIDVFGIEISNSGVVLMSQWAQPLIPFLFDPQSELVISPSQRIFEIEPEVITSTAQNFAPIITGSHTPTFFARVITEYQSGENPRGIDIPIISGDVSYDATAEIFADMTLVTDGLSEEDRSSLFPRRSEDFFAPYGNEIFIRRGVDLGDNILWCPMGYFRINTVEQNGSSDSEIRIIGQDRMSGIVNANAVVPYFFRARTKVRTFISRLVTDVYPNAVIMYDDDTGEDELGNAIVVEESRYDALQELVESRGKIMYWDGAGVLRIEDAPDPDDVVMSIKAGRHGVLAQSRRRISRNGMHNAVLARGEGNTRRPVKALAVDVGVNSPTRYRPPGPFGRVPYFFTSPLLQTDAMAQHAAEEMLKRKIGMPYSVDFGAIVNPALRPRDVVQIEQKDGNRELHHVETLSIPLSKEGLMTGTTKEKTSVRIGLIEVGRLGL